MVSMCYSAMVEQNAKKLAKRFGAIIDEKAFIVLFEDRLKGNKAKISRAMEIAFFNPETDGEKQILKAIETFHSQESARLKEELEAQENRLADAEYILLAKSSKKAENDRRIATDKIKTIREKLERLNAPEVSENDNRLFPYGYAPLVVMENGKKMIRPFRYLMRPRGQDEEFDRKFSGCYNARLDGIAEKNWWKTVFGQNHGFMVVKAFYENVPKHVYEKRQLAPGEKEQNLILKFEQDGSKENLVPCIFDHNAVGPFPLESFALITDEPNPEVKATGHDRTPVVMREKHIELWLKAGARDLKSYDSIFKDKEPTYFKHSVV